MISKRRMTNDVHLNMILRHDYPNATSLLSWLVSTDRVCTEYLMLLEVGTVTQLRRVCQALDPWAEWSDAKQRVQALVLKVQPRLRDYAWYEKRLMQQRSAV